MFSKETQELLKEAEDHLKADSLNGLRETLNTTIRAFSLGEVSHDETEMILHMIGWLGEISDYQDTHATF